MWAQVSFVLSQFTRLTDKRTDMSLVTKTAVHRYSAVEVNNSRLKQIQNVIQLYADINRSSRVFICVLLTNTSGRVFNNKAAWRSRFHGLRNDALTLRT